ncbi:imidazolonepropionase [Facilibium subflavum]|uniref:imidazolonepropionase n=1 Tax=Facilibium subflavum TaxID=2219058 RepID=UPI000E65A710|nr:imidazolonepropionase [Facilibium subflavum]
MYDLLIKNAHIVSFNENDDIYDNAHILIDQGNIIDILPTNDNLPEAAEIIEHHGKLVTPGLIDCHTHVVYGGSRADEFEKRLQGVSYKEIAESGGGIISTVNATRKACEDTLFDSAKKRLLQMMSYGTTTCEIKSGYGLDLDNELKMLKVAKALNHELAIDIIPTFLGAHALPKEYQDKDAYIDDIINNMLPALQQNQLSEFVDGFCESIGFSHAQIKRLFTKAKALGFKLKLHAEQLSDLKGAKLAAQMGACSVDHLEYLAPEDVPLLKQHNTVAVLLPGAFYFLKETKLPPVKALLSHKVDIAIATDANPGSSPFLSLPLMMNMACVLFGLTPYQAFKGTTLHAAKALGFDLSTGSISINKKADIILWDCQHYNEIVYNPTFNYCQHRIKDGQIG